MFKHIKLTTIRWLFALLMLSTCLVLGIGTLFLERNITLIDSTWEHFQTDRSEKARLESVLRAAIGYGGMIHEFKNFVLRQEPERMDAIQSHIGAARAVLHQYSDQEISEAEAVALEDISTVLNQYDSALLQARQLIDKKTSIRDIDATVRVNDSPALRGMQTLRAEVRHALGPDTPLSKARISADLRASLGYGGMIHEFKNYVLRHNVERIKRIELHLELAHQAIQQYDQLGASRAEQLALEDIKAVLLNYNNNLKVVTSLISEGHSPLEIDVKVRIDDTLALRGLNILDRENSRQVTSRSNAVSEALNTVNSTLGISIWGIIALLLFVAAFALWLMQRHIIRPIMQLTGSMVRLADNDLEVQLDKHYRDNELGDMARTVMVFKENMVERVEAEKQLADANEEMNERIHTIHKLREEAQAQASTALGLAEGLAAARESAEKSMARAEQEELRVRSILNAVHDAIFTINTLGIIESVNPAGLEIFGYRSDEMLGNNVSMLMPEPIHSQHDGYLKNFVEGASQRKISDPAEQTAIRKDGSTFTVNVTLSTIEIEDELKIIGVIRDITERKQWEEEIQRLAMTDPLTALANRNQYNLRLEEAEALSKRVQQPFALLLIDLDKFKPVNDTYGHPIGDALLQHVAQVLSSCCREVDTVARLGGDEFAIILAPIEETLNTDTPAQRIIEELSQPVLIKEHSITIGASIGISCFPNDSSDLEALQQQADMALYQAKEEGRNTYRQFTPALQAKP